MLVKEPLGDVATDVTSQVLGSAASALLNSYTSMEIRSALTPPITLTSADLLSNTPPSAITSFLQPTLILHGSGGQDTIIAPGGQAGDGTLGGIGFLAGLLGVGYLMGRLKLFG